MNIPPRAVRGERCNSFIIPGEGLFQRGSKDPLSQGTSGDSVQQQLQAVRSSSWLSPVDHGPRGQEGVSKECV